MSLQQRRRLIDPTATTSLRQQCQWLNLARSSYYYQPCPAPSDELALMRLLDEQYLKSPQFGYRKMGLFLRDAGYVVNHKRVLKLMQVMGLEAIYPKPNTSQPALGHTIYPYLLRGLPITRVHQVWATDITAAADRLCADARWVYVPDGHHGSLQSVCVGLVGVEYDGS